MKKNQKKMVSIIIKEGRLAKGFTQKELSELSNISIRSIQRIENGEILPRSYTLKTLAEILGLSFENINHLQQEEKTRTVKLNQIQKIILSIGISLFIILLVLAFVAQSPAFPETHFETILLIAFILLTITVLFTVTFHKKR